jgi:hypothetical protein
MKDFKDKNLSERLRNSAQAKKARLQRVREMPGADDPNVIERKSARQAMVTERAARIDAKARKESERAAREASQRSGLEKVTQSDARGKATIEAEQKTRRDARYAARKKQNA